ncbi:MAG TPA: class I SAM-dependent methyltransferase [Pirellulales bacterium]|nr:class I SAM-dependent methyltransferase [Pirellulales bacterium]
MPLGDFTEQAEAYGRARPSYPDDLLNALIARVGVSAGDAIADLGAGTGLLTEQLAARGFRVTAVEPNEAMRRQAKPLAGVRWVDGTFESSGLETGSQTWAVAAQAFHWADPPRALPEVKRLLKPGGFFTVLWNNREHDRHPVLAWTCEAIQRHVPGFDDNYRDEEWSAVLTSTGDFAEVVCHASRHVVPMDRERYLNLWRSHNRLKTLAGQERLAAFLQELTQYLAARGDEPIGVSYLCRAWTARAVPQAKS